MVLVTTKAQEAFIAQTMNEGPIRICASTFGLRPYGGPGHVMDFLDRCSKTPNKSQIVVGTAKHTNENELLGDLAAWPDILWKLHDHNHLKCMIFWFPSHLVACLGGRNLTDSDWYDATVVIEDVDDCLNVMHLFDQVWKTGTPVEFE